MQGATIFNSTGTPAYAAAGTTAAAHIVVGSGTASGSALAVTLSGAAAFTSGTTYNVFAHDQAHTGATITITYTSGTAFTITYAGGGSTATDGVTWAAVGT
jgi:hypothetical protein